MCMAGELYTLLPFLTKVNYQCTGAQASVHFLLQCTMAGGQPPGVA
jgi:hypothetical protein